jgi:hypothetical protein
LLRPAGLADNRSSPGGSRVMSVRHWKIVKIVVACLVLSAAPALADPGSYETMMKERMLNNLRTVPRWKDVPDEIKVRYSECFAASLVAGLSPDEIQLMNSGTQGVKLDEALAHKALDQLIALIDKLNNRDLTVLEKACPNDIADFKKAGL